MRYRFLNLAIMLALFLCLSDASDGSDASDSAYGKAVLTLKPDGYWRLEEKAIKDKAKDDSGAAALHEGAYQDLKDGNLQQSGPNPKEKSRGVELKGFAEGNKGVEFQKGNSVIIVPDTDALDFAKSGAFTVSGWAKGPSDQTDGAALISKGQPGSDAEQFTIDVSGGGYWRLYVRDDGKKAINVNSKAKPNDQWQFVLAVCDTGKGLLKLYVNGKEVSSGKAPGKLVSSQGKPVTIGSRPSKEAPPYDFTFDGKIDEVAVWKRALSEDEIKQLYYAGFGETKEPKFTEEAAVVASSARRQPEKEIPAAAIPLNMKGADGLGWKLGAQAYSFNKYTFFEAVDKTVEAGMKYIEAYPGQTISKDSGDKLDHNMSGDAIRKVKEKLKSAGVKMIAYGVVNAKDEAEWRKIFEFANTMGIEAVNTEPKAEQLDYLERLCEEYQTLVGFHNHPKPSPYWDPEKTYNTFKDRSRRMGFCADTGHWPRSTVVSVEAIQKYGQRIVSMHFKDLDKAADGGHDVPWGTGACDAWAMLAAMKKQYYKGPVCAEYEYNWEKSVPEIALSAQWFNMAASAMNDEGWTPLFYKDLSNAQIQDGGWAMANDELTAKDKGSIWTKDKFGDFALSMEFKCDAKSNGGVSLRCVDPKEWEETALEVWIAPEKSDPKHATGAVDDCQAPVAAKAKLKPAGEWNQMYVVAMGGRILVALNGEQINDVILDKWIEAGKNPDGSKNKYKTALKDMAREGVVGLQCHGAPAPFRNVKVKALGK